MSQISFITLVKGNKLPVKDEFTFRQHRNIVIANLTYWLCVKYYYIISLVFNQRNSVVELENGEHNHTLYFRSNQEQKSLNM